MCSLVSSTAVDFLPSDFGFPVTTHFLRPEPMPPLAGSPLVSQPMVGCAVLQLWQSSGVLSFASRPLRVSHELGAVGFRPVRPASGRRDRLRPSQADLAAEKSRRDTPSRCSPQ